MTCPYCFSYMLDHLSLKNWKRCPNCSFCTKEKKMIDWTDSNCQVSEHFTVGDALTLHSWNRLATVTDGADFQKLEALCQKMEQIRSILGCPINVHCMFRSIDYNKALGIIPNDDVHAQSEACDFDCGKTLSIDDIHTKLLPLLESLGIRMERNTPTWVHVDLHPVVNSRYFLA